jgi:hypothetical protein
MIVSASVQRRRRLASVLGDLYFEPESVRRMASAAGITPGQIPQHARAHDTWSAILAQLDAARIELILIAVRKEYPANAELTPLPPDPAVPAHLPMEVSLQLAWSGDPDGRQRWRSLEADKTAIVRATVRVDAPLTPVQAPMVTARARRLWSGKSEKIDVRLAEDAQIELGFGKWTAVLAVPPQRGWWSRRIEVEASVPQTPAERRSLLVVSERSRRLASGIFLILLAFVALCTIVLAPPVPLLGTAALAVIGVAAKTIHSMATDRAELPVFGLRDVLEHTGLVSTLLTLRSVPDGGVRLEQLPAAGHERPGARPANGAVRVSCRSFRSAVHLRLGRRPISRSANDDLAAQMPRSLA